MQTHCHERVFTHSVISFIQIHADFYVLLYTFPMKFLFINVSILTIHFIVVSSHRILNGDLNWYSRLVSTCQLFFFFYPVSGLTDLLLFIPFFSVRSHFFFILNLWNGNFTSTCNWSRLPLILYWYSSYNTCTFFVLFFCVFLFTFSRKKKLWFYVIDFLFQHTLINTCC